MQTKGVLIVTDKLDPHADRVIDQLRALGRPVFRLNIEQLLQDYQFTLTADPDVAVEFVDTHDRIASFPYGISACYYRKPSAVAVPNLVTDQHAIEFIKAESQEFLRGFYALPGIRWVNHPLRIPQAQAKVAQLAVARSCGLRMPRTIITSEPSRARQFISSCQGGAIAKTLSAPSFDVENVPHVFYTHKLNEQDLDALESVRLAPTMLQEYIPKRAELRITIIGSDVFACEIDSQSNPDAVTDWRQADAYSLPPRTRDTAHRVADCWQGRVG